MQKNKDRKRQCILLCCLGRNGWSPSVATPKYRRDSATLLDSLPQVENVPCSPSAPLSPTISPSPLTSPLLGSSCRGCCSELRCCERLTHSQWRCPPPIVRVQAHGSPAVHLFKRNQLRNSLSLVFPQPCSKATLFLLTPSFLVCAP